MVLLRPAHKLHIRLMATRLYSYSAFHSHYSLFVKPFRTNYPWRIVNFRPIIKKAACVRAFMSSSALTESFFQESASSKAYGSEQIQVLEGLDPVRKRPGMYIGSTGPRGLHHLVYEILDNAVDEAQAGFAAEISVVLCADGSVSITDDGRGIPTDLHPVTKKSSLETVLTVLNAGGKFGGSSSGYSVSGGLHGVGLSVVNALSESLEITVWRDGVEYQQKYSRGKPMTALTSEVLPPELKDRRGTGIKFWPDKEVFTMDIEFDYNTLAGRIRELAFLNPKLKITFKKEDGDLEKIQYNEYYYAGGLVEYVNWLNTEKTQSQSVIHSQSKMSKRMQLRFYNLLSRSIFRHQNSRTQLLRGTGSHLCTIAESPDVPDWFRRGDKIPESSDSGDDFVIPSVAQWAENHPLDTKVKNLPPTLSDIDILSKILKTHFQSSENVVQALEGCGVVVSNSLIEQVLKRFSSQWINCFGVFSWAKTQTSYVPSQDVYNLMVDILGKSKKFKLMWQLVEEMKQIEGKVTFTTITKVIRRLARGLKYQEAIDTFKGMDRFSIEKDIAALNVLMDALVKEGSYEHALEAFSAFKNTIGFDSHSYNILIHGLCKCRKYDDARSMLQEMENLGIAPTNFSYTSFVSSYCHDKDFRSVDSVLQEMTEKGCPPNVVTYTIYMHALGKSKQINEALEIYKTMKDCGCTPDTSFYNSLIYILNKAGRFKDADELFDDMPKQGVDRDVMTFNSMIMAACSRSKEMAALDLLKKMDGCSCRPNLTTYQPLLKMCMRMNRMRVLDFLWEHMMEKDVSPDLGTHEMLVIGLCKSGKLDRACWFFEEMLSKGMLPREKMCRLLVEKLEGSGMVKEKEIVERLIPLTIKEGSNVDCAAS